ncbi:MAG: GDSL family lipase [Chloroflexales bacterium]|nr:GDSL family lipase [Chloroflexales bacterium]
MHLRPWLNIAIVVVLLGSVLALAQPSVVAQPSSPVRGLSARREGPPDAPRVRVVSPERFTLVVDGAGIAGWFDLATDPNRNLVAPGGHLLAHSEPDGAPFRGRPRLVAVTPARTVVSLEGRVGNASAVLTYTIWAGGQVVVEARSAAALGTAVQIDPAAASGATFQSLGTGRAGAELVTTGLLYLGAWTPDEAAPGDAGLAAVLGGVGAAAPRLDPANTLLVEANGSGTLELTPPDGVVRQPRFKVSGWPGPARDLALAGQHLVEGVDYLADWDQTTGELNVQYLGLLPPGDAASRSFTLGLAQTPTLAVEVMNQAGTAPRTLSPAGLLTVDGNLPSTSAGRTTIYDVFSVPYIQTWPELRLRATVANAPAGLSGVRFQVSGPGFSQSSDDNTPDDGYGAVLTLPRRAEYSVTVTALVSGQPSELSKTLDKVAYGRVFVSIGDSITSGLWGPYWLSPTADATLAGPRYTAPISSPPAPASGYPVSADGRNYPQSDNIDDDLDASGTAQQPENTYFRGYQVELNDRLSQCLNSPVFILNDGFSGIRTARDRYQTANPTGNGYGTAGDVNVLGKAAVYRSHFSQLGAQHILLQIGTNDASTAVSTAFNDPLPGSVYNQDLRDVIAALRLQDSGLTLWVARLPWRNDPPGGAAPRQLKTIELNTEIGSVVAQLSASTATYLGPDFYSYFDAHQDQITALDPADATAPFNEDNIHPTAAGLSAMAQLWAETICAQIAAEPTPSPVTPSPVTPSPVTPSPSPGCGEPGGQPCLGTRVYLPFLPIARP